MRLAPVFADIDRRLERGAPAPLVVAVSGGGDSLALMLMAAEWARGANRRLIIATVDHRLQPAGADWAQTCAVRAAALGLTHRTLAWDGPKPSAGLPAAARAARHRLLANLARSEGAGVILMGHTADDALEAAEMRRGGSSTPSPRAWAPSPAWPEGRGVFVFRPLLAVRRAALRIWLEARGESWIDDPANDDPRYARAQARRRLAGGDAPALQASDAPPSPVFRSGLAGELVFQRAAFAAPTGRRLLAAAVACAAGASGPASGLRIERLLERLRAPGDLVACLAGARIEADVLAVTIGREAGEYRRGRRPSAIGLPPGAPVVWDGRFEIEAFVSGLTVRPLAGLVARLQNDQLRALKACPPSLRGTLPAIVDLEGRIACPILAQGGEVRVRSLVAGRFAGAVGAVQDEGAIWRVAKCAQAS